MGTFLEWKWLCPVFRVKWNRCLIAFISQCDSWSLHFSHGIVSTFTPCHTVMQWRLTPYTMSHGGAVTTDSYIHNITVKADPCTLSHGSAVTDNICILLVTILQRKLTLTSCHTVVRADPYVCFGLILHWTLTKSFLTVLQWKSTLTSFRRGRVSETTIAPWRKYGR